MDANFTELVVLDVPPEVEMLESYVARVFVSGTTNLPLVEPFHARFDDEVVEGVAVDIEGTGFTGFLRNKPSPEARLFVEFVGQDPLDTGLTFSSAIDPLVA